MEIGVQFYTIRDYCKDLDSLSESLKKVADIGYTNIQLSGTCNYDALWMKEELIKNGLKCVLTHISPDRLKNDLANVIAEHNVFQCDNIGLGWYSTDDADKLNDLMRTYLPIAQTIKENGKYFMYHNHDHEFRKHGDKLVLEHIIEGFSPDIMGITLDTFWVQAGGADPAYWIEKLAGRVPCIHLKDFSFGRKMAALGDGNINFDRVFEKAELAGTKYMLVEQDDCNGENPFDCLKRSYDYLKSRGF